jgi:hypothetical protein
MGDVARAGRTVVLVSHQLNQIRRLCQRVAWVDGGSIRQSGPTHEVVSAYESAMLSGERLQGARRGFGTKAQFLRWEIAEAKPEQGHILSTLGPVTFNFVVELAEPIRHGEQGVALFNGERQLMWARAEQNLCLESGVHLFSYSLPSLPLRPGAYQWQVSIWDGDEMLDLWDCVPEMTIATEGNQHYMDDWNGVLNLPFEFFLNSGPKSDRSDANRI